MYETLTKPTENGNIFPLHTTKAYRQSVKSQPRMHFVADQLAYLDQQLALNYQNRFCII